MKINEIFYSIQGEGPNLGMAAIFIRVSGCNFNCDWCDTEHESGVEMTVDDIVKKVTQDLEWAYCHNIIITGGEPLIQPEMELLIKKLVTEGRNIHIETNGSVYNENLIGYCNFVVSPKLENIEDVKTYYEKIMSWNNNAVFKFVIGDYGEFTRTREFVEQMNLKHVYFMPRCSRDDSMKAAMLKLVEWVKQECPNIKVTPRLQIYLYGLVKGT
jgi:7-carboxy-7-deazaguanine synthase